MKPLPWVYTKCRLIQSCDMSINLSGFSSPAAHHVVAAVTVECRLMRSMEKLVRER